MISSRVQNWYRRATWVDLAMALMRLILILVFGIGLLRSLTSNQYEFQDWVAFTVFGLTFGSIYSLISLGYTMVYGVLRMINFAHGDVFMAGAFGGYIVAVPLLDSGSLFGIATLLLVGGVTSAAIAVAVERIAYRPFLSSSSLAPLICAIGVSFILQYSIRGLFGTGSRAYAEAEVLRGTVTIAGHQVEMVQLFVIGVAILAMVLLHHYFHIRGWRDNGGRRRCPLHTGFQSAPRLYGLRTWY
jgi:branched-chain amino acid transport system permease protein